MKLQKKLIVVSVLSTIAIILFCGICHGAKAEKPRVFTDDDNQALLNIGPRYELVQSDNYRTMVFWEYKGEIRFVQSTRRYVEALNTLLRDLQERRTHLYPLYERDRNSYELFGWKIGEDAIMPLDGEFSPYASSSLTGGEGESKRIGFFIQPNGYLKMSYTSDHAVIRFDDGNCSFLVADIKRSEDMPERLFAYFADILYDGDDRLIAHMRSGYGSDSSDMLFIYQISTGEYRFDDVAVKAIAPYSQGSILIHHEGGIRVFNAQDGTVGPILAYADEPVDPRSRPFAYDHKQETLYYLVDGDLFRLQASGAPERIVVAPASFSFGMDVEPDPGEFFRRTKDTIRFLLPLDNGQLAYALTSNSIFVITPTALEGEIETLRIACSHDNDSLIDLYHTKNPHVLIEKYPEIPHKESVAKNFPECDVYAFSSSGRNLQKHFREGKVASLSDLSDIEEKTQTFIAPVQELIRYQGDVMAVPYAMRINPWFVNITKWEAYGFPAIPQTADELFDFIELWDAKYSALYPDEFLLADNDLFYFPSCLMYMLTEQYITERTKDDEPLQFDTDLFISILDRVISLPDLAVGTIEEYSYPLLHGSGYNPHTYNTLQDMDELLKNDSSFYLPMGPDYVPIMPIALSENGAAKLGAILNVFVMNSKAPNPVCAEDFLALASVHHEASQRDLPYMLSPDEQAVHGIREDVAAFYLQNAASISFSIYALGPRDHIASTFGYYGLPYVDGADEKAESMQLIIDEFNHQSELYWPCCAAVPLP